jgi:hypothetical protein
MNPDGEHSGLFVYYTFTQHAWKATNRLAAQEAEAKER